MPEGLSPQDHTPFKEPLMPLTDGDGERDRSNRILKFEGDETRVVRVDSAYNPQPEEVQDDLRFKHDKYQADQKNEALKTQYLDALDNYYDTQAIKTYRDYLANLENVHGIKHSGFMPLIGEGSEGQGTLRYIVTDRIQGLSGDTELSKIPVPALIKTLRGMLSHYIDVCKNGGPLNYDLKLKQFIYDEDNEEMILVDHELELLEVEEPNNPVLPRVLKNKLIDELKLVETASGTTYPDVEAEIEAEFAKLS